MHVMNKVTRVSQYCALDSFLQRKVVANEIHKAITGPFESPMAVTNKCPKSHGDNSRTDLKPLGYAGDPMQNRNASRTIKALPYFFL